ncbi:MAG: hypothetical protein IT372_34510 [Polyangiaceae bacterium]|nr:hypothetical protein [Polyangiaceae bacterium]
MNRTRWIGMAAAAMALLSGAVGCGGASMKSGASAPAYDAGEAQGYGQPAPAGYGHPAPASQPGMFDGDAARSAEAPSAAPEPFDRPGLGTQWGETRMSSISTVSFLRATPDSPFGMASLFYNDEDGARAMAQSFGFRRTAPQAFTLAGGAVALGLRGEGGGFLSGFVAGERSFVIGEAGQRYSIVLQNLTPNRIECVVSVDGLDVMDGQPAAFAKRGYVLDPHDQVEIDGFRQSMDTVAAFRFGSVRGSYANQKHGETRNVGVIGVALFHERGTFPWTPDQVMRRRDANPFPGQFATPPGQ